MNYDEVDGDRLRLPANRNCYRLSRISWALLKLLVVDVIIKLAIFSEKWILKITIICANFGVEKLWGLGYTGRGQILESPIEMAGHPYNSAALPCSLWYQDGLFVCRPLPIQVVTRLVWNNFIRLRRSVPLLAIPNCHQWFIVCVYNMMVFIIDICNINLCLFRSSVWCHQLVMYTLLSGLWRYVFQKDEYFVLILGLDNAGKTVSQVPFWLWVFALVFLNLTDFLVRIILIVWDKFWC